jgi:hypothetical protein
LAAVADATKVETPRRAGRLPKENSRADELRERLLKWSYFPPEARPSLRRLAEALGTSHQLLSHLLIDLEQWERKQDLARVRVLTGRKGVVWTETQQTKVHLRLRKFRMKEARSYDAVQDARTEALINAMYTKLGLKQPPPKDPMAIWTKPPREMETWSMLWPE